MNLKEQVDEIRTVARAATGNGHKAGTNYVWQYQAIRLCDALEETIKTIHNMGEYCVNHDMMEREMVDLTEQSLHRELSAILNGKEPPHAEHS